MNSLIEGPQKIEFDEDSLLGALYLSTGRHFRRSELYLDPNLQKTDDFKKQLNYITEKRLSGMPLSYIIGSSNFFGREYFVNPSVIIPRPETEILVDKVVERFRNNRLKDASLFGAEIGLGSGVISIEILKQLTATKMVATEVCSSARGVSRRNACQILGDDWFEKLEMVSPVSSLDVIDSLLGRLKLNRSKLDFLVSNPPYISGIDEIEIGVLEFEPHKALFPANCRANYFYSEIAKISSEYFRENGFIAVEIPHQRYESISAIFQENDWMVDIQEDLTGRPRVLIASKIER